MAEDKPKQNVPQILIADDVESNRFILKEIISEMGYQPILTENGVQALRVLKNRTPALIILDIAMPEMGGYEVCEQLKKDPETRDIPIIFISAFDDPTDIEKGLNLGGADYITKPFMPEIVKARVNIHLKLYDATRDMAELNRRLQVSIAEQRKQMEMERRSILYALIRVARENACYNDAYMERFTYNCRTLTEAMQLSDTFDHLISDSYIDTIELAAPLCDLGNMAIPTNILQKQGKLTEEESEIMRTHTTIGARILQDVRKAGSDNALVRLAEEIARNHHENWDGSGYPEGKEGDEIPLSAQIVSIVDSYCALTERRSYREPYTQAEALEIMEKNANSKFNPEIFYIMKKVIRQLH